MFVPAARTPRKRNRLTTVTAKIPKGTAEPNRKKLLTRTAAGLCARKERSASPEAVTQLGNLLTVLAASPWMFTPGKLGHNGLWLILLGSVSLGVPYLLYSRAIREVRALDATLITMVEPILNPVWVMIATHERPSGWSLMGGCLVLSTSLARSFLASRECSPPTQQPGPARVKRVLAPSLERKVLNLTNLGG